MWKGTLALLTCMQLTACATPFERMWQGLATCELDDLYLDSETGQPVRLPTEDEWNRIHDHVGLADVPHDAPAKANLHLDHWASSCPVTLFPHGELFDVVGNVWQWCETPTYPFDGFEVHPIYDDFTTPTFDDRHAIIKGGSWLCAANFCARYRPAARQPQENDFSSNHIGFRIIRDAATPAAGTAR